MEREEVAVREREHDRVRTVGVPPQAEGVFQGIGSRSRILEGTGNEHHAKYVWWLHAGQLAGLSRAHTPEDGVQRWSIR